MSEKAKNTKESTSEIRGIKAEIIGYDLRDDIDPKLLEEIFKSFTDEIKNWTAILDNRAVLKAEF